jgi:hypothetical protein
MLDDPVFQRMKCDHCQPSPWSKKFHRDREHRSYALELIIYCDPERLEGACGGVYPFLASSGCFFDQFCQLSGGGKRSGRQDAVYYSLGIFFFSIFLQDL